MTRFQKFSIATTTATFLLIGLGGFVRAAGAGLGCPDWPKCFGRWIPPTDASQLPQTIDSALFNFQLAWIEYVNRLVGIAVGVLILATAWIAWRDHRREARVFVPSLAAVPLVIFQGWFGGQVVAYELDPRLVTIHLLVALAIVAVLITATSNSFYTRDVIVSSTSGLLTRLAQLGLVLVVVQICVGAFVRANIDMAVDQIPHLDRGDLVAQVGLLDEMHRSLGLIVFVACAGIGIAASIRTDLETGLRRIGQLPMGFATVQFGAGVGLAYLDLPPSMQVTHILFANILFGSLFLFTLRLQQAP